MQQIVKDIQDLLGQIESAMEKLDIKADRARLEKMETDMASPDFWNDAQAAAKVSQEAANLKKHVNHWIQLRKEAKALLELAQMGDESLAEDLQGNVERLQHQYGEMEFELKLSGPYDRGSAILSIYAGTGGIDAQDWAEMLQRMYLRYSEKAGLDAEIIDQSPGEEAGIKSATIEVNGPFAYGKLKGEKGVHRLVRLSPFNADNLRQTSFAMVEVLPQLDHPEEMEIDPKDLRIDVFRAGGHGGQSVNTTDSAVRITHIPTNTVVAIQNERSQLQNKEKAMAVLKARLTSLMLEQQKAQVSEIKGAPQSAEWGSQIRSYVLHPYTQVKDHRTGVVTTQAAEVLEGDLDKFIEGYLQQQIGAGAKK